MAGHHLGPGGKGKQQGFRGKREADEQDATLVLRAVDTRLSKETEQLGYKRPHHLCSICHLRILQLWTEEILEEILHVC